MKKILTMAAILAIFVVGLKAQVILQDSFNYANGSLTNVSGNLWTNYSGNTFDTYVNNGHLEVFAGGSPVRTGDTYRPFTNTAASVIFASFTVVCTNQPVGSNYFAHFSSSSTVFKGRIFGIGNAGTAPNSWRLGITAGAGNTPNVFPLDLATNVIYKVVMSYDTAAFSGTLWVDPVDPSDANTVTSDITTAATIKYFSFRQSNSGGQAGQLLVDDLYVGNSFSDVNVGAVKAPTVYTQPPAGPTTNFVGGTLALSCVAGGAGTVTFQWQHAGTNLVDDANDVGSTSNILTIVSAVTSQSGNYACVVTSTTNSVFAGSVTSAVSQVVISVAPVPPTITTQPSSNNLVYAHSTVVLNVVASGPPSFSYQWFQNGSPISDGAVFSGTGSDTLTVSDVAAANGNTGTFQVQVTNPYGTATSSNAVISVTVPAAVSIAYLRTLVDPTTYNATNVPPTIAYQVTGVVTTFTNITTGNTSSYYLQDGTAGINIFATFPTTDGLFRPAQGDVVTFVGVLSSFTGLELYADAVNRSYTSYTIVSNNAALPTPVSIPFDVTNNLNNVNYNLAGSLVQLSNVYFGTNAGVTLSTNAYTAYVTNSTGQGFRLSFFATDQDTWNQTLPAFAYSVTGVLYGGNPNFSLAVTKFSDINTNTVVPPSPIPLNKVYSAGTITFSWSDASFSLQSSTNVAGPYTTISGASSAGFSTNTAALPTLFFRLFHP